MSRTRLLPERGSGVCRTTDWKKISTTDCYIILKPLNICFTSQASGSSSSLSWGGLTSWSVSACEEIRIASGTWKNLADASKRQRAMAAQEEAWATQCFPRHSLKGWARFTCPEKLRRVSPCREDSQDKGTKVWEIKRHHLSINPTSVLLGTQLNIPWPSLQLAATHNEFESMKQARVTRR